MPMGKGAGGYLPKNGRPGWTGQAGWQSKVPGDGTLRAGWGLIGLGSSTAGKGYLSLTGKGHMWVGPRKNGSLDVLFGFGFENRIL